MEQRDHGGNLDWAIRRFGGSLEEWIDLSTGINRQAYPVPDLSANAWQVLPTASAQAALRAVAARAYGATADILPVAGAQAAIQLLPNAVPAGQVRILGPTYNEFSAAFEAQGRAVSDVGTESELDGAGVAVLVNPNNPDGRCVAPDMLRALAGRVGFLVVDESFGDVAPELSLCPGGIPANALVLRSFGKFFGLAGVRLGFAIGARNVLAGLAAAAGPWAVSGPALEIGRAALSDIAWQAETRERLAQDARRMDALAATAGWQLVGGTGLFRLYDTVDAAAVQAGLGQARIWSRIFPYSPRWVRLGLPGTEREWTRIADYFSQ